MSIFVYATEPDMNRHTKILSISIYRYFQINILVFEFLQFCTMHYCININLVVPTA
jgi:hypothetical protein